MDDACPIPHVAQIALSLSFALHDKFFYWGVLANNLMANQINELPN